jgi:hypothetical protein
MKHGTVTARRKKGSQETEEQEEVIPATLEKRQRGQSAPFVSLWD